MSPLRSLRLAAALVLLAGCDPEKKAIGVWEVVAIDGVGPRVAPPARVLFPAGAYGADTLAADFMWHEYQPDSLVLTLQPGGTFQERMVERERALVHKNTYERPDYVSAAFGGDLVREEQTPAVEETTGRWTLAGDSLVLTEERDQLVAAVSARIQAAIPTAPEASILDAVGQGLGASTAPRWSGMAKGDRLELRAADGRVLTFRRAAP